jgi:ATP-dependent DNA helicase RecQ
MALSGVARMKGRWGKQMIARMLVGSKAKELEKYRLNQLSTFGILTPLTEPQAGSLIDALLAARLLEQFEERPHRPLVRLTPRGEEVMKGAVDFNEPLALDESIYLRLLGVSAKAKTPAAAPSQPAPAPNSSSASHVLEPRVEMPSFYDANALLAAEGDEIDPSRAEASAACASPQHSAHYWTYRLLTAGFSIDDCQQIRSLDRQEILKHVLAAAREGQRCELEWIMNRQRQAEIGRVVVNGAANSLAAVLSSLPPTISAEEAELFWRSKQRSRGTPATPAG